MTSSSILTGQGQITLPLEIRERLGLKEGDRLELIVEGDHVLLRPTPPEPNVFHRYIGALAPLPDGMSVNQWLRSIRDDDAAE